MKLKIVQLLIVFIIPFGIVAQEDPTDIGGILKEIDELGLPTVDSVKELKDRAYKLYEEKDYLQAAEAFKLYSKNVNWLANLISSGLEPYYGASYEDRKEYPYAKLKPLIPYETQTNKYRVERNIAMVKEALCYIEFGEKSKAASLLYKSLDLIDIDNYTLWEEARIALYKLIGVK